MKKLCQLALASTLVLISTLAFTPFAKAEGQTRTYCIAVDEIDWDYTPMGRDQMMGMPYDKMTAMWFESGKHQIGRVYHKAVYRQYFRHSQEAYTRVGTSWPAGSYSAR